MDIIRAGYDQLIRAPTKTITFTGGAGAGAVGSAVTIWTISGRVLLERGMSFCSTTLVSTSNTGTIALGVPNPEFQDMTGAFADDVAKTNLAAILPRHGPENVRSL